MPETISRADLTRIVREAAHPCSASAQELYEAVARTTRAVAVGWFHCEGVGCPARQAGRPSQVFQERFDNAMWMFLGLDPGTVARVEVTDD